MSRYEPSQLPDDVSQEAVQAELDRILASDKFSRSGKLRSLLKFTVTQTLQGNAGILKEYVIGTEVLEKPASYDPRSDSLVRVLASRLRTRLRQYYSNGGSADPLVIDFPKGGYIPIFHLRERFQTEAERKIMNRNLVSRGRFQAAKLTKEALARSVDDFRESISADPSWPPAYESLGNSHILQAVLGFERPREVWPMAKQAIETSLELDDLASGGHVCLGIVQAAYEWNWKDAELHFTKAIARDSYSGIAYIWRALMSLIPMGHLDDALEAIRRSRELTRGVFLDEGYLLALYLLKQYDAVLELTGRMAQIERSHAWIQWVRSMALAEMGQSELAKTLLEQLVETDPDDIRAAAMLAYTYTITNDREKALQQLTKLEERKRAGSIWIPNYDLAVIQAALGNQNEAVALLHECLKQRELWALFLFVDPRLASLRGAQQLTSLARRIVPEAA